MAKNKFLYIIIFFALAVYLVMGIYADFAKLVSTMEKFRWDFFILLLIFTTISYVIRFIKWDFFLKRVGIRLNTVSYTHLRAHETRHDLVCRLLLEKKNK